MSKKPLASSFHGGHTSELPCIEPKKRLVGGRYGWAVHRFPIKGGVTAFFMCKEELRNGVRKPSYFGNLLKAKKP